MKTGIIVLIVLIIGGALIVSPRFFKTNAEGDLSVPVSSSEHIKGSLNAPLLLVEYSDFQCPACKAFFPVLKIFSESQAVKDGKISFVYRHFPLSNIHPRAESAARAAEAAGLQGKFFEMHDMLFEKQTEWADGEDKTITYFITYAKLIGLDIKQFEKDFNDKITKENVANYYASGLSSNTTGTPSFYLNGEKLAVQSIEDLQIIITNAINNIGLESPTTKELE